MSTATMERRAYQGVQIRELETNGSFTELSGIAVPYNVETDIGWFVESFERGALDKSIAESAAALPLLMFHDDMSFPIGSARSWDSEAVGLRGVWTLDSGPEAQRAARLVDDKLLNFMSIRFVPVRSAWSYAEEFNPDLGPAYKDRVVRQEARLLETSLVSTPAYNGAVIEWARTAGAPERRGPGPELAAWQEWLKEARG